MIASLWAFVIGHHEALFGVAEPRWACGWARERGDFERLPCAKLTGVADFGEEERAAGVAGALDPRDTEPELVVAGDCYQRDVVDGAVTEQHLRRADLERSGRADLGGVRGGEHVAVVVWAERELVDEVQREPAVRGAVSDDVAGCAFRIGSEHDTAPGPRGSTDDLRYAVVGA